MLSKRPLQDVELVPYATDRIRRVIVYATVAGVRFAFVHLPLNYLAEIDVGFAALQRGPTQGELVQDLIAKRPDVVVGDFNSGPDYQPAGHNLLVANGYNPLFAKPTYCPQSTHASFPPCQVPSGLAASVPRPASIDNIYINTNAGFCLPYTFAIKPVSDHIGVSALCGLRK
jgi:endonuclease/exonuclease/phosphatase family metal-dependent hydrolase